MYKYIHIYFFFKKERDVPGYMNPLGYSPSQWSSKEASLRESDEQEPETGRRWLYRDIFQSMTPTAYIHKHIHIDIYIYIRIYPYIVYKHIYIYMYTYVYTYIYSKLSERGRESKRDRER